MLFYFNKKFYLKQPKCTQQNKFCCFNQSISLDISFYAFPSSLELNLVKVYTHPNKRTTESFTQYDKTLQFLDLEMPLQFLKHFFLLATNRFEEKTLLRALYP